MQLNRRQGLWYTAESRRQDLLISVGEVSVREQSSGLGGGRHGQEKAQDLFCTHCQHSHSAQEEKRCHLAEPHPGKCHLLGG